MNKIYIDQNILTRLDNNNNKTNLDIILNSKKNKVKYYYSFGHIYDFLSIKDEGYLKCELEKITKIVENNYISYRSNKKHIKMVKEKIKPISQIERIKEEKYDILDIAKGILKDYDIYRKYKSTNHEFKSFIISDISKFARGKLFGISSITYDFLNLFESVEGKNDIKDRPNTKLTNINADYFHCYFATCCDCFVTNDDRLFNKVKKLYELLNDCEVRKATDTKYINTKVYKLDEFIKKLKND